MTKRRTFTSAFRINFHMSTRLFCPSCGTPNVAEQSFCRSCGFNLQKTAASLLEQMPTIEEGRGRDSSAALEKFGNFAFTGLAVVVVAGIAAILYTIVTKMILSGSQPIVGVLLAAFVVFAGLALGYVFWRESLADAKTTARAARTGKNDPAQLPALPADRSFEPIPSVVEGTTRRLKITRDLSEKADAD